MPCLDRRPVTLLQSRKPRVSNVHSNCFYFLKLHLKMNRTLINLIVNCKTKFQLSTFHCKSVNFDICLLSSKMSSISKAQTGSHKAAQQKWLFSPRSKLVVDMSAITAVDGRMLSLFPHRIKVCSDQKSIHLLQ